VACEHGLNAKYLNILWKSLHETNGSQLLDDFRARWKVAKSGDAPALAAEIAAWQKSLWTFSSVGLIGRVGGPKAWMEPIDPLTTKHDIKFKMPDARDGGDVTLSLVAGDAGDGNENDFVVWQSPRLVTPGRPDLLLRDLRDVARSLKSHRTQLFGS